MTRWDRLTISRDGKGKTIMIDHCLSWMGTSDKRKRKAAIRLQR